MMILDHECTPELGEITAAQAAYNYSSEDYSDWYLPSLDELMEIYSMTENDSLSAASFSVDYQNDRYYWSSTSQDGENAKFVDFYNGNPGNAHKNDFFEFDQFDHLEIGP